MKICRLITWYFNGVQTMVTSAMTRTTQRRSATKPGSITLLCKRYSTLNGCISIDSLEITENRQAPSLFVAPPFPLTCAMTAVNLKATATGSTLMPPLFQWQSGNGHFVSGNTKMAPSVYSFGNYSLTVTDPASGCTKTGGAIVFQNITPPPIQVLPANLITCSTPEQTLQGQNQAVSGKFTEHLVCL